MSGEGLNPVMEVQNANIAQALMEEDLEREIQRNEAATRMAREREEQAAAARKRAEESQKLMTEMMSRYEIMKAKLDFTKKHLDETNDKIVVQEKLTDKITKMKERVEMYSNKKEAVECLNEAIKLKAIVVGSEPAVVKQQQQQKELLQPERPVDKLEQTIGEQELRKASIKEQMINHIEDTEARIKKREELKAFLEEQVSKGEMRAKEQTRIAKAREELLELRLRELKLQQQRLERKKEQQQRAELDNQEFLGSIDKEIEEMESRTSHKEAKEMELAALTAQREKLERARAIKQEIANAREKTKQLEMALRARKEKMQQEEQKKQKPEENKDTAVKEEKDQTSEETKEDTDCSKDTNENKDTLIETEKPTPKVSTLENPLLEKVPETKPAESTGAIPKQKKGRKANTPKVMSPAPADRAVKSPTPKERSAMSPAPKDGGVTTTSPGPRSVMSPERGSRRRSRESSACSSSSLDHKMEGEEDDRLGEILEESHHDLSVTVKKIEGKCMSVKGDLAEMAMSEQYLRTKQAMLMAKKKEKEMGLAEKIAGLREAEAAKLREKVKHMQELLSQRREKLKIQEEIMKEKTTQKQKIDKLIESRRRRGDYCEKELIDRVVFEHPPSKKK